MSLKTWWTLRTLDKRHHVSRRLDAAIALGSHPEAILTLIELLDKADPGTSRAARDTLLKIKSEAVGPLVRRMQSGGSSIPVAEVIARIDRKSVV